ncbi:putative HTH-type transcriptional regulator [uncultured archaeon]|nr:putative HTH-type transcriptional regulator [uncultured archaeon]
MKSSNYPNYSQTAKAAAHPGPGGADSAGFEPDEKDAAILGALRENARQSVIQLTRKTRIPPTTIHHRLAKMKKAGVITQYTIRVDRKKLGLKICALIFVTVDNARLEPESKKGGLAKRLLKYPQVEEVFETTGTIDVIVKVYGKDVEDVTDFVIHHIREIAGVTRTETVIALSEAMK